MDSDQPGAQSASHGGEVGDDEGVVAADGYAFVVRLPKSASAVRLWAEPVLRPATNMLAVTPGQIRRRASPGGQRSYQPVCRLDRQAADTSQEP
jgi:hypothetical protein